MSPTSNQQIVRGFIEDVWNRGLTERIADFVSAGFVDRAYNPPDAEGHRSMVETLKATIADAVWTVDRMVADDTAVICEMRLTGTHTGAFRGIPASGNPISVRAYRSFVLSDGEIVEHAALLDTQSLLAQMKKDATGNG